MYNTIVSGLREKSIVSHVILTSSYPCGLNKLKTTLDDIIQKLYNEDKKSYQFCALFTGEGNGTVHLLIRDYHKGRLWFTNNWRLGFVRDCVEVSKTEVDYDFLVSYLVTHVDILDFVVSDNWIVFKHSAFKKFKKDFKKDTGVSFSDVNVRGYKNIYNKFKDQSSLGDFD